MLIRGSAAGGTIIPALFRRVPPYRDLFFLFTGVLLVVMITGIISREQKRYVSP